MICDLEGFCVFVPERLWCFSSSEQGLRLKLRTRRHPSVGRQKVRVGSGIRGPDWDALTGKDKNDGNMAEAWGGAEK